jgi:hypothetical protein
MRTDIMVNQIYKLYSGSTVWQWEKSLRKGRRIERRRGASPKFQGPHLNPLQRRGLEKILEPSPLERAG